VVGELLAAVLALRIVSLSSAVVHVRTGSR
jgi:hypothetical protein